MANRRFFGIHSNILSRILRKVMGFNKEQMTNAFGLSGYFAPIPCLMKYMHTANNGMHAVKKL